MTPSEYQELTGFLADQLDRHHRDTLVIIASLRPDIRGLADGVQELHRGIDENTRAIEEGSARIEANGRRPRVLTERVERLETTVSTRFDDHEARLRALQK